MDTRWPGGPERNGAQAPLSLTHARIAYLSACSTVGNKTVRLSDEVIHEVAGSQWLGFPMWEADSDRRSTEPAWRWRRMGTGWDGREVASAAHKVVMAVREAELDSGPPHLQFITRYEHR